MRKNTSDSLRPTLPPEFDLRGWHILKPAWVPVTFIVRSTHLAVCGILDTDICHRLWMCL